jgi:hypothetical protein
MTVKYVSAFVKKMRALSARIKDRLVWNSAGKQAYIKSKYGKLV